MKSPGQLSRFGRFSKSYGDVSDEDWKRTFGQVEPKPLTDEERGTVRKDYRHQRLRRVKIDLTKPLK